MGAGPRNPDSADEVKGILKGCGITDAEYVDSLERRERALTFAISSVTAELDQLALDNRHKDPRRGLGFSQAAQMLRDKAEAVNRETPA